MMIWNGPIWIALPFLAFSAVPSPYPVFCLSWDLANSLGQFSPFSSLPLLSPASPRYPVSPLSPVVFVVPLVGPIS